MGNAKICQATTIHSLGAGTYDDGILHRFGVNTHAICVDADTEEKVKGISAHSVAVDARNEGNPDADTVLSYPDRMSDATGAWPDSGWFNSDLGDVFKDTIVTTASVVNNAFAVASGGAAIYKNIVDTVTTSCDDDEKCQKFQWSIGSQPEVAHQAKFGARIPYETSTAIRTNVQAGNTTTISYILTLGQGEDNYVSPRDPGIASTDEGAGGIPRVENMSRKERNKWGVKENTNTNAMNLSDEAQEPTHIMTNPPTTVVPTLPQDSK